MRTFRFSLAILLAWLTLVPWGQARAQWQSFWPRLKCRPERLYRGDSLTIDLPEPHDGVEFGIFTPTLRFSSDGRMFLISFKPTQKDTIPPVIAPEAFARMKQVVLPTTTARGTLYNLPFTSPEESPVKPSALIFTKTVTYWAELGRDLGADLAESDDVPCLCEFDYFDRDAPKPGENVPRDALFAPYNPLRQHPHLNLGCPARTLYRGDTLAVDLPKSHRGDQFAIVDPDWTLLMISFNFSDAGVAPAISSDRFARMNQARLLTKEAKGSRYQELSGFRVPQPIFTRSGWYLALIGTDFRRNDNGPFGTCWFHYVNESRVPAQPVK